MQEEYASNPEDVICCITPSIGACHFEVDEEIKDQCEEIFRYTNCLNEIIQTGKVIEGKQKYHIDLVLLNKLQLREAGLKEENIIDSKICSVCNSDYIHSYRATGNHNIKHATALIGLR